jgi:hypothetical protein
MDRRVKQTSAVFQDHYQHEQLRTCRERGITVCILLNSPLQQKQLYDSSKMFQCPHQTQWPHSFIATKQSDKNPTMVMHCNTFASSSRRRFEGLPDPNGQPSRRQEKRAACQSNRYKAFSSLPLPLSLSFFFSPVEPESPTNRHLVLVFVLIDIHQPRRAGYQHLNIELLTWDLELNTRGAWLATTLS